MLQSFYNNLGFFGALILSFVLFVLFILWLAGIAGITLPVDGGKPRGSKLQLITALLIPLYPICWIFYEMYHQRRFMKKDGNNLET